MAMSSLDELFTALPQPERAPGFSVLVERGSEILYEKQTGYASLEYGLPNMRSTCFHVASVSKQFTALCVTLLEEEGRIDLASSIRRWFPELPSCMECVTVRHLLHHTGGLREQWDLFMLSGSSMEDLATPDQTLRALARQTRLNFAPGTRYQYCNSGYILLAQLVERVTGRSLRQYAWEHVFKPLGMNSTYFRDDHREICYDRAESYQYQREQRRYAHLTMTFDLAGNTSLNTVPKDLCRWLAELDTPQTLPPAVIERMKTPFRLCSGNTSEYCRGIWHDSYRGQELFYHTGANAGFRAVSMLVPRLDLQLAVLSNYEASLPLQKALRLLDLLVPEELTPRERSPFYLESCPPLPEGVMTTETVRIHVTPGPDCFYLLDGAEWTFRNTTGNEFSCTESSSLLYVMPDGSLVRREIDGAVTTFQPVHPTPIPDSERALAGFYFNRELLTIYEIGFEGDTMTVTHLKRGTYPFRRIGDGRYISMTGNHAFMTLHGGDRPTITLDMERSQGILFEKTGLPC